MKTLLSKIGASALDLLFPMQCAGCGREGDVICEGCVVGLPRLSPPYCDICASPNTNTPCRWCGENPLALDGIRAPYLWEGTIRRAILDFKYRGIKASALLLGRLLAAYLADNPTPGEIIVPVPLHSKRHRSRGYNQSALLGKVIAKNTGIAFEEDLLARTVDSLPQVSATSRRQRMDNVVGIFRCDGDPAGKSVILVDDVATSGSTLSSCASVLKAAGATQVWGLTLARE